MIGREVCHSILVVFIDLQDGRGDIRGHLRLEDYRFLRTVAGRGCCLLVILLWVEFGSWRGLLLTVELFERKNKYRIIKLPRSLSNNNSSHCIVVD